MCVTAALDRSLPPILFWTAICLVWFLLNATISSVLNQPLPLTPKLPGAFGLAVICLLIGGSFLGPLPFLLLIVPPLVALLASFGANAEQAWSRSAHKSIRLVAACMFIAIIVGAIWHVSIRGQRTDGAFIVQWSGSSSAHSMFNHLRDQEPSTLPTYRYIVENGNPYYIAESAERIAAIGQPGEDLPRLKAALQRVKIESPDTQFPDKIQQAIRDLENRSK